ncbi:MAG: HNH endonuclease [Candidatus Hydrogenedentes bacterium]|nr:HNH endonuclease [Candidatus Hydrogenedentota bacterium]
MRKAIHKSLRETFGYPDDLDDKRFLRDWKHQSCQVCKPCWELKYCPYGPLVEQFPVLPLTRAEATAHHERLKGILEETSVDDQRKHLDAAQRRRLEVEVARFNAGDYPQEIPEIFRDSECSDFGHICPVFFVGESFTESAEKRRRGRYISFAIKMRVVRRDNHTCQVCGTHLKDEEVEFDHIIPLARGGNSEEHNIRLTCFDCNRHKSDHVDI